MHASEAAALLGYLMADIDRTAALATELAAALPAAASALAAKQTQVAEATAALEALQKTLDAREEKLSAREQALATREAQVAAREAEATQTQRSLERRDKELQVAETAVVDASVSHASAPPASFMKPMSERLEMQVLARATAIALVKHGIQATKAKAARAAMPPPPVR